MTSTTFDEAAFELLPRTSEPLQRMRKQAFEEFRALPIPSQETEEWRYTDLSDLDLSFTPHVHGHGANAPPVSRGERAATLLQHNSSVVMTTSNQDLEG